MIYSQKLVLHRKPYKTDICIFEIFSIHQLYFLKLKTHPEQHDICPPRTSAGRNQLYNLFTFLKPRMENRCKWADFNRVCIQNLKPHLQKILVDVFQVSIQQCVILLLMIRYLKYMKQTTFENTHLTDDKWAWGNFGRWWKRSKLVLWWQMHNSINVSKINELYTYSRKMLQYENYTLIVLLKMYYKSYFLLQTNMKTTQKM